MKGLYIVTPDWDDTQKLVAITELALRGGAALVQYRHKNASPALREEQASRLLELCRRYQRPFIINDHVDLCIALDADGVHVGGTDTSVAQARAVSAAVLSLSFSAFSLSVKAPVDSTTMSTPRSAHGICAGSL